MSTEGRLLLKHEAPLKEAEGGSSSHSKEQDSSKKARYEAGGLEQQPRAYTLGMLHENPPHHAPNAPALQYLFGSSSEEATANILGIHYPALTRAKNPPEKAPFFPVEIHQPYVLHPDQTIPYAKAFFLQWRGQELDNLASQSVQALANSLQNKDPRTIGLPLEDTIAALRSLPKEWTLQIINLSLIHI